MPVILGTLFVLAIGIFGGHVTGAAAPQFPNGFLRTQIEVGHQDALTDFTFRREWWCPPKFPKRRPHLVSTVRHLHVVWGEQE